MNMNKKPQTTTPRSNEDYEKGDVSVLHDHIYFYSSIHASSALTVNKLLQETSMRLAPTAFSSMQEVGTPSPIWLHINSYGGEVFSAFAIADTIERIAQIVPVVTIVEGCAASGASFMSIAGTKRLMRKNAYMLIHELNDSAWGRHSDMLDHMESNINLMKTIKEYYKEKTKIPSKELDKILERDVWWNAKKCLKYGLVDAII